MGIRGLASYAAASRHISRNVVCDTDSDQNMIFVLDAFSVIWHTFLGEDCSVIQGGDYQAYVEQIKALVKSWLSLKICPIFIFDGPAPHLKHAKLVERMQDIYSTNSVFMRSSSSLRTSAGFQRQNTIMLPLLTRATLSALEEMHCVYSEPSIEQINHLSKDKPVVIIADFEADNTVASLAESLNGYAVSQDADYFVLCGRGQGAIYSPLDDFQWNFLPPSIPREESFREAADAQDDGFQVVGKKGARKPQFMPEKGANSTLRSSNLALSRQEGETLQNFRFKAYSSSALAVQLGIPPSLLPLLATLLGSDYFNYSDYFFVPSMSYFERITAAASVIALEWKTFQRRKLQSDSQPPSGYSTPGARSGRSSAVNNASVDLVTALAHPVRYMVTSCIRKLIEAAEKNNQRRPPVTIEELADLAVDAILCYGKAPSQDPKDSNLQLLFSYQGGSEGLSLTHSAEHLEARQIALQKYVEAYRNGKFSSLLLTAMTYRHVISLKAFYEDPGVRSIQISHCRPIRLWIYAILFSAYGLNWARTEQDIEAENNAKEQIQHLEAKENEYLDEVISVGTDSESDSEVSDTSSTGSGRFSRTEPINLLESLSEKPDPFVWEEVRRAERLTCEPVAILSIGDCFQNQSTLPSEALQAELANKSPIALLPEALRLEILQAALFSSSDGRMSHSILPIVAVLRFIIKTSAQESPDKRSTHWFRPLEVQAVLLSALLTAEGQRIDEIDRSTDLDNRHVHFTSIFHLVLENVYLLAESLLLTHLFPQPHLYISGPTSHSLLRNPSLISSAKNTLRNPGVFDETLELIMKGLEDCVFVGATKQERKERKKREKADLRQVSTSKIYAQPSFADLQGEEMI